MFIEQTTKLQSIQRRVNSRRLEKESRVAAYADYAAPILGAELRAWHERDRHFAFEGVYAYSGWVPIMTAKVQELERVLVEAPPDSEFTIVRYEWESGLD